MEISKLSKKTRAWLDRVARHNNVTPEEVLKYLQSLSRTHMVMHHLDLVGVSGRA